MPCEPLDLLFAGSDEDQPRVLIKSEIERLRRALLAETGDPQTRLGGAVEFVGRAYRASLDPEHQAMFDRHFLSLIEAAEICGPEAEVEQVLEMAQEIRKRPH